MAPRQPGRKTGFRIPDQKAVLAFEDGPYKGLEVTARLNVPMRVKWVMAGWADIEEGQDVAVDEVRDLMVTFGDGVLLAWNLEDDDGPVPPTGEAFADRLDQDSQLTIVRTWLNLAQEGSNGRE